MKTVNDLIKELQALKPSLKEKPVVVIAENGLEFEAKVKVSMKRPFGAVEKVVITY